MRSTFLSLIICLFLGLLSIPAHACTVFSAAQDNIVLGAANKDWDNLETRALFIAPSEGKYGHVYFGYQIPEGFQNAGGMNDQGLWYDGATLPERNDIHNHHNKPTVKGELCEKALEECATVDEVIALYARYHTPHWQGHSMWADRMGNSVIIEYGDDDVVFLHKQNTFQVMTNHYLSDTVNTRWYNCYRYNLATDLLENSNTVSINSLRSVLDAVHQSGIPPTVYSNIYDLKNGKIYVHNFHNYDESLIFDIQLEMDAGGAYYKLPEMFQQIWLRHPVQNIEVDPSEVEFNWNGEAESYTLTISKDSTFSEEFIAINIDNQEENQSLILFGAVVFSGLLLVGFTKKANWTSLLIIVLYTWLVACSIEGIISPYEPSDKEYTQLIYSLEPDQQYYWKISTEVEPGIVCESITQNFKTI
ncbi:MAG: hypothetical protein H8E14_11975 [Candidatus Marinimicrobia bacterium]|nr:hypothetical protein [Candidatus Neomarinimicrobiota bacterium]MBL7113219.1 hypothetical protein [Bacteroidales bacterium]